MSYNNETVIKYYVLALEDLSRKSVSVSEMSGVLSAFEELEDYEACEGILQAINDYKQINNK